MEYKQLNPDSLSKKVMNKFSLFFLALLTGVNGYAQQPAGQNSKWTLEECIEYAAQHNLQVKQGELNLLSSKVELDRSKADLYPTLNAGGGYGNSVGRSIDPFTNVIIDEPVTSQNYFLSSGVTLFNGLSKQNLIKQNKLDFKASELEVVGIRNNISMQIASAYLNILFNRELLANAEARLRATGLQVERTRKQVEVGTLPQASLYELQAQFASDELEVTNAINRLELARLNLKQLLQLPAETSMEIVVPEIDLEKVQEYPVSAREVYDIAEDTRPEILASDVRVESTEYGVKAAKGNLYPNLSANGGLSTAYSSAAPTVLPKEGTGFVLVEREEPIGFVKDGENRTPVFTMDRVPEEFDDFTYTDQLDYNLRRYFQLSLNIPIFNGYRAKSSVAQARIASDRARLQSQIVRQELRQNIEQAALDVKAAALTYKSIVNQVRSLKEAFRSAEQRFNLGATNAVDYNLAKTNLDIAESNLIRAKYDYILKTKILDFYRNQPLSFE